MKIPSLVALTCKEVVELVSEYMHDELGAEDRARLEQHFHACTWCMTYLGQMRRTVEWSGQLGAGEPAREAVADALEMFRSWKRERS